MVWPSGSLMVHMSFLQLNLEKSQYKLYLDVTEDTVNSLRNRLHAMKEVFGDSDDDSDEGRKKRDAVLGPGRKRRKNCMDTIIDGSLMGMILAACLCMVLGAAFFAYKNLYFAVVKKFYDDS